MSNTTGGSGALIGVGGGVSATGGAASSLGGSPALVGGGPAAGNPDGNCTVPTDAQAADTSQPDHVIGDGSATSCTPEAVVSTIALGGKIAFNCGPDPIIITLKETAKIVNDTGPEIVIDGGGLVTLRGAGQRRILYMDTCDEAQKWTSDHCQNQDSPHLTIQNLTFVEGNSTGQLEEGGGGGAVLVRGGRFKVNNCRFFNNVCDPTGPRSGWRGIAGS